MDFLTKLQRSSYVRSIGIRGLNGGLGFAVSVLLARLLGPSDYGAYGVILSTAAIIAIPFTAGLPRAMAREVAAARVNDDPGLIRLVIRRGRNTFLLLLPILAFAAIVAWKFGLTIAGTSTGILVAALVAPMLAADSNRMAIMQGMGQAVRSQIPDMIVRPVGTAIIVTVLLVSVHHVGPEVGAVAYASATLIGFLVGAWMIRPAIKALPDQPPKTYMSRKMFLLAVFTLSILGSSKILSGNIDMILLNSLFSLKDAGLYKVALAGMALVVMGNNAIATVANTRLAEAVPGGDKSKIAAESDRTMFWALGSSILVMLPVIVVGRPVISAVYGSEYLGSWSILLILGLGFSVSQVFGPVESVAMFSGQQLRAAAAVLLSVAVSVGLAFLFAPIMGVHGVALASTMGLSLRQILVAIFVWKKFDLDLTLIGTISRALQARRQQT
ncbi:oligosaccharide flippase family protein [Corynebacterium pelargi]|uniref:Polysaccharide biosynthesis protein n=1 Tax=Corynebacterium pelargi TaxID=1471400 RepID=A0A410W5T3_9CORY|nr:oligosaccharide flippase family protein [Corynebacterium pelargi]QAU51401.1 Polysaccharide biosynthesis protein [Corynebacterium pelargi]GGG81185.1 hypothetical protein GCM10007338_19820 [Corynebacterium pelargi]